MSKNINEKSTAVFDPGTAPPAFDFEYTPTPAVSTTKVTVRFVRAHVEGRHCYVGTAINKWGHHVGGGTVIIWADGQRVGGRSFSHILSGGDRRRHTPYRHTVTERDRFVKQVKAALSAHRSPPVDISKVLTAAMNFPVHTVEGSLTKDDLNDLVCLSAPQWVVEVLEREGIRPVIDPADVVKKYVRRGVSVRPGEWGERPRSISWTSAMPCGVVEFLKRRHYTLSLASA